MNPTSVARGLVLLLFVMLAIYIYMGLTITPVPANRSTLDSFSDRPYEVLKHYLATQDVELEVIQGYDPDKFTPEYFDGLSTDNAVAFRKAEVNIDTALADSIFNWVEAGGMLILSGLVYGETEQVPSNALFHQLGIRYVWPEVPGYGYTEFEIENHYSIQLNLESGYVFSHENVDEGQDFWAGTGSGATIIQKPRGSGYITLMTEIEIWNNRQIDDADNVVIARFLLSDKDKLIIFGATDKPHWLTELSRITPGTLLFLGLLTFLGLWFCAIRFGSVQRIHARNVSAFILHLKASANYYWRIDKHQAYIESIRERIRQEICRKYSLRSSADIDAILPQLSEITNLSPDVINQALQDWQPSSESDYIHLVKQLQIIRNHL